MNSSFARRISSDPTLSLNLRTVMTATFVFLCLGVFSAPVLAQTYVFNQASFSLPSGQYLQTIAVGDFNGDGKPDLVFTNEVNNTISIMLSKADGTFQAPVSYPAGTYPSMVAVADFNGDGKLDFVVTSEINSTVSVVLGNGDGTFGGVETYAVGGSSRAVVTGDFNNDGIVDLAVLVQTGSGTYGAVSILLGNGDGTFQPYNDLVLPSQPGSAIAVTDLNNDGKLDLVVATSGADALSVLLGNGDGTFQSAVNYYTGSGVSYLVVGDFNGDGNPDVVFSSSSGGGILLGNGDGTLQAVTTITAITYYTSAMIAGDFNGDGKLDIAFIATTSTPSQIEVLLGNGDGTFHSQPIYAGAAAGSLVSADFNGDGKLDFAFSTGASSVAVVLGNGDGTFTTRKSVTAPATQYAAVTGDFNGDGKLDLAVANAAGSSSGTVSIYLGNGDGTYQPPVNYAVGSEPESIIVGAFHGGTTLDLVTVNYGSGQGTVSILAGNGDGTFQPHVDYTVGSVGYVGNGLVAGDFNGDGKLDLAVATSNPYPSTNRTAVAIMLGNGNGTFQPATMVSVPNTTFSAYGVATADFNHDGKLDLAVTDNWSEVYIFLGKGDGTFSLGQAYTLNDEPNAIAAADFNGDGKVDLAVTQFNTGEGGLVSILLGNGDGTFQTPVNYLTGVFSQSIAMADFNGDGNLDVAVANTGSGSATVLFGKGDGTFPVRQDYLAGAYEGTAVAAGDFNGDGAADLVVLNNNQSSFSVYLSQPVIAFSPAAVAFGARESGTTSATETITISNPGSVPLQFASLGTTGPFTESNTCGAALAIGANCTGSVAFAPSATGPIKGAFNVADNAPASPQAIPLSGSGFSGPGAVLSASRLIFTSQEATTTSAAETITITNNGAGALSITNIATSGDFGQTNNCASVNAGGDCTISVTFTPSVVGDRTGTLTITENAWNNPLTVGLTGQGVGPAASLTPPSLAFANQIVGGTSAAQTIGVNNNGHSPLVVGNISATGNYSETNTCNSPVAAGSSCSVSVTFAPTTTGSITGSLTVTSNASNSPNVAALTGTGIAPYISVSTSVSLGTVLVGVSSAAVPISVYNYGTAPLTITSISTTGSFSQTNTCSSPVPPSGSCSVNVIFTPTAAGSASGTLNFVDNALNTAPQVTLSGTGTTTYSVSYIASLTPLEATVGGAAFTLTVSGLYFGPASVVYWNGSARATTVVNGGQLTASISAADIASTGIPQVTVVNPSPGGTSSAVGFDVIPATPPIAFSKTAIAVASGPQAMVSADFNGDGKPDLAVANGGANSISILLGNGNGTFQQAVNYPAGFNPTGILVGDFNNDGKLDLAVANLGCPYGGGYCETGWVSVFLGNGDGTFQSPLFFTVGLMTSALAAGDFNGDGILDLAIASGSPQSGVTIYLGQGDGTFKTGVQFYIGTSTSGPVDGIAVADFNGDGKADLAVAEGNNSTNVAILLGNGDGTFKSPVEFAVGNNPFAIFAADFNGDGKQDLAVANFGPASSSVSILFGNGDGTFQTHVDYPVGVGARSIAYGDFNGDGKPDLLVADQSSGTLSLLLGNGGGTFQANQDFTVSGNPLAIVARDFNGDGQLDVVEANYNASSVTLLLQIPLVSLQQTALAFGNQPIGTTSGAQPVVLKNTGGGLLTFSSIAIMGTNAGDFGQTNNCGSSLARGLSCTINVTYSPTVSGAETATLTITDNASGSPQSVSLTGTGTAPVVSLSAALTFSAQLVNSTSSAQTVTLTNTGSASLTLTAMAASGPFAIAATGTTCSTSTPVPASGTCTVAVTFTPTTGGSASGSLSFTDNAPGSPQSVGLSGAGQDFTLAPPSGSSSSQSVAPGQPATYTISLGGMGGFSGAITFTCTGAPSEATCTISPNPAAAGSNVTVTVTTTAASLAAPKTRVLPPAPLSGNRLWLLALAAMLAALAFALCRERALRWQITTLSFALLLMLAMAACGGGGTGGGGSSGNPGTPAGTYTLTVTGTAGAGSSTVSHSMNLTLSVT